MLFSTLLELLATTYDALALMEKPGKGLVEVIFKKHVSPGFDMEPDIK